MDKRYIYVLFLLVLQILTANIVSAQPGSKLSLTVRSKYHVRLEWEDNMDNEQNYKVERRLGGGSYSTIATVNANTEHYNVYGISPRYIYTFRIKAVDSSGSTFIYTDEVTVNTEELAYLENIKLTAVSSSQVDVEVVYPEAVNHATIVERRQNGESTWEQAAHLLDGDTSFRDKGLKEDTLYYYRAKAIFSSDIQSSYYPSIYGTPVYTLITAPGNLYGYPMSDTMIYLTWDDNSDETNFVIERKENDGEYKQLAITGKNVEWWYDDSLTEGHVYIYRVKAIDGQSTSAYSDELKIHMEYVNPAENLKANSLGGTSIELSWVDNKNLEGNFELWRKGSNEKEWKLAAVLPRNARVFRDEDLESGSYMYKIRVFVEYKNAYSAFSEAVKAYIASYKPPQKINYSVLTDKKIKLTWNHGAYTRSGYKIERRTDDGAWITIGAVSPGLSYYHDSTISPYTKYYYRIKVYSSSMNLFAYSEEIEVHTGIPRAPEYLKARALSPGKVSLYWDDKSDNEDGFILERKKERGNYFKIAGLASDSEAYTDLEAGGGTLYAYRIRAFNKTGFSKWSNSVYLNTPRPIGFDDVGKEHEAHDAVEVLAGMGVVKGSESGKFMPDRDISRAEFICFVVRAFKIEEYPIGSFNDVTYGYWYYNEIISAANAGIITGDENDMFRPDENLKKEDMAVIICRVLQLVGQPLGYTELEILDSVKDSREISPYARQSIAQLIGGNLIDADEYNKLNPKKGISRAKAVILIYRLLIK